MKFKVAITVVEEERPFKLQVAIPKRDRFIVHDYHFKSLSECLMWFMDYINQYKREPWTILDYHQERSMEFKRQLDLPFGGL